MPTKTTTQPAAKASRKPKTPETSDEAQPEIAGLLRQVFEGTIREWALEESKHGRLSRQILRAERDGKRASVAHIVKPIIKAIAVALDKDLKSNQKAEHDPKTGNEIMPIVLPPEWK